MQRIGILLIGLGLLSACSSTPPMPWEKKSHNPMVEQQQIEAMDTVFTVRLWLDDRARQNPELIFKKATNEIMRIARIADDGDASSEISKVNALAYGAPRKISKDLYVMLDIGRKMWARSRGAFDITFLPILKETERYGKDAGLNGGIFEFGNQVQDEVQINVGDKHLNLNPAMSTVKFERPGTKLGVKGLAKGYAVQRAAEALLTTGVRGFAVMGGSVMVVSGLALDDQNVMCIEHPSELGKCIYQVVPTERSKLFVMAVSASAERPGHMYNPKDGVRKARIGGVTVVGADAAWVQATATACSVLDNSRTSALLQTHEQPLVAGIYFDSEYTISPKGTLAPFAKLAKLKKKED